MPEYIVSPSGRSGGNGSLANPWDLQTALNKRAVLRGGDTVLCRDGIYRRDVTVPTTGADAYMFQATVQGSTNNPIVFRPYEKEKPRIDGYDADGAKNKGWSALYFQPSSHDIDFRGFEIFQSNPQRTSLSPGTSFGNGVYIHGDRIRLINNVIHDNNGDAIGWWQDAVGGLVYGNVCYHNGLHETDSNKFWGHGLYGQNAQGVKHVRHNVMFQNWSTGIGPHSSANSIDYFHIDENVVFQNGSYVLKPTAPDPSNYGRQLYFDLLSAATVQGLKITKQLTYYKQAAVTRHQLHITQPTANSEIRDNIFLRGNIYINGAQSNSVRVGNTLFTPTRTGWVPTSYPANTYLNSALELGQRVFVLPNEFDGDRALIVIYNMNLAPSVGVYISALAWPEGSTYQLRQAQDYFGDVRTGTYDGQPITIDMAGSVATPTNWPVNPATTLPEFGVFVIARLS